MRTEAHPAHPAASVGSQAAAASSAHTDTCHTPAALRHKVRHQERPNMCPVKTTCRTPGIPDVPGEIRRLNPPRAGKPPLLREHGAPRPSGEAQRLQPGPRNRTDPSPAEDVPIACQPRPAGAE
uniref:Uncharacterized protein n=1 Tax=Molossus molossus TaxID=27622 RepID=A0A7J8HCQ2_MOLMO|nr:hypothetical protein HJG59_011102 [Molossus molossus]